ncbi:MAG TPA: hypothetical protein VJQ77_06665 [Novosphingobium sp.]|nr:hypothetical protein [Novosphingobium sp.]
MTPAFVIKAEELPVLNHLRDDHPRPLLVEWINRGTNQRMNRSTVDMLLRTLSQEEVSPSVERLHQSAGLRLSFGTDEDRNIFAAAFANARAQLDVRKRHLVAAMFDSRQDAERVVSQLESAGIPKDSISLLWRAGQFVDPNGTNRQGHSKRSVAAAVAGGGIAGAMLGVAFLAIPGIGLVAAVGAIAASSFSSVAAVSAVIGATGGAMARMLTDHDVDGREANYFEREIRRGKVFVSVDTRIARGQREVALEVLLQNGGHSPPRG